MSMDATHPSDELPDVDERLVAPGSGYEILDGQVVRVPPAHPPHATRQAKVAALLVAHVRSDFQVATEMLTRTSRIDDIAPDASVFTRDPATGKRRIEELAFEVVSTQTIKDAGRKAAKLSGRGVRRVFGIDLERERLLEWSRELGTWSIVGGTELLVDPVFVVALPISALLDATSTDDAMAAALLAKGNSVLEDHRAQTRAEGRAEGRAEAQAEALLLVLAGRGLLPTDAERAQIRAERDPARLERWLAASAIVPDVTALFDE
jgi:Uma2 family endonuclease